MYRPDTAFQSITTRQAWYTATAIAPYHAVQWGTDSRLTLADGSGPFAGIVEYGTEAEDQIATVVTGIFPVAAAEDIAVGDKITFTAGEAVKATGAAYGIAINKATKGTLVGVALFNTPTMA